MSFAKVRNSGEGKTDYNTFAKQTDNCHAELVSTSYNRHGDKTLKRVQGDKAAFTKPSRGTNESERRTITSGNRAFRFVCERCRLTRGAVDWSNKKVAFTLAEVLITLGIIGVVAALTLPSLIQNHRNQVVETRLQKFYSTINQAVKLAEVEYGDKKWWFENLEGAKLDDDGNPIEGTSESVKWFKKYIAPHMQIVKIEEMLPDGTFMVYFPDGSALKQKHRDITRDWLFFPGNPKKCIEKHSNDLTGKSAAGICVFHFTFFPICNWQSEWLYNYDKGFEPYKWSWDGTTQELYDNCYSERNAEDLSGQYCAALMQHNGWKIPKNYPYKVSY